MEPVFCATCFGKPREQKSKVFSPVFQGDHSGPRLQEIPGWRSVCPTQATMAWLPPTSPVSSYVSPLLSLF